MERLADLYPFCHKIGRHLEALPWHSEKFKTFVATGASDQEVADWISKESRVQDKSKIATWALLFQLNPINLILDGDDWFHRRKQRA